MNIPENLEEESYYKMLVDLGGELAEAHANSLVMITMLEATQLNELQKSILRAARERLHEAQQRFFVRFKP